MDLKEKFSFLYRLGLNVAIFGKHLKKSCRSPREIIIFTANYWRATQTNQYYWYATHTNINYSYATLPIEPFTVTSLMLVMLALTLHNRFNTIILPKSYLFSQSHL
jgi:hypothetical protein